MVCAWLWVWGVAMTILGPPLPQLHSTLYNSSWHGPLRNQVLNVEREAQAATTRGFVSLCWDPFSQYALIKAHHSGNISPPGTLMLMEGGHSSDPCCPKTFSFVLKDRALQPQFNWIHKIESASFFVFVFSPIPVSRGKFSHPLLFVKTALINWTRKINKWNFDLKYLKSISTIGKVSLSHKYSVSVVHYSFMPEFLLHLDIAAYKSPPSEPDIFS